ncbi:hypothetical protein [Mesohalobacter halotolerans]|jgi:heme A synthase|uniref:50S ribosomal protein L27 n=1 Tax=Mesohalobacter halotolerans TaxID=1883405 RepID=A0A4U5TSS4_9FLAO|nr:hypothetical protein [Mesohalobacter halotolerans]MBS3737806.1 hypothetical protein [Psychroflexus sp.]NBC57087.1 hypothetical protein [Bacteroidota bacterium]TKS57216.1 hypothetical protein FCN74_02005 [Mesohalobacter halotolerans]
MYTAIQHLHSYWAYLVLLIVVLATFNAIIKSAGKKPFVAHDFRISLFALIVMHLQLLIGLVLYFVSPYFSAFSEVGMGGVMKDETLRLYLVEHPTTMILAIVFITMGYSKHKKKLSSSKKFKTISIFYAIALILLLSRIPWQAWF